LFIDLARVWWWLLLLLLQVFGAVAAVRSSSTMSQTRLTTTLEPVLQVSCAHE
jgi:hypothetical protein